MVCLNRCLSLSTADPLPTDPPPDSSPSASGASKKALDRPAAPHGFRGPATANVRSGPAMGGRPRTTALRPCYCLGTAGRRCWQRYIFRVNATPRTARPPTPRPPEPAPPPTHDRSRRAGRHDAADFFGQGPRAPAGGPSAGRAEVSAGPRTLQARAARGGRRRGRQAAGAKLSTGPAVFFASPPAALCAPAALSAQPAPRRVAFAVAACSRPIHAHALLHT